MRSAPDMGLPDLALPIAALTRIPLQGARDLREFTERYPAFEPKLKKAMEVGHLRNKFWRAVWARIKAKKGWGDDKREVAKIATRSNRDPSPVQSALGAAT